MRRPSFKTPVGWFEKSTSSRWVSALLAHCDSAQGALWNWKPPETSSKSVDALDTMNEVNWTQYLSLSLSLSLSKLDTYINEIQIWGGYSVMRTNTLRTFVSHGFVFDNLKEIEIVPSLDHVGRSSWRVNFDIYQDRDKKLIANVRTTMVATNDDHDRSVSLPNRDVLKTLVAATKPFTMLEFVRPYPSPSFSVWYSYVRQTDCDSLGHVNNSIYPLLCEEARSYGLKSGEYKGKAKTLASCPTSFCQVSYINQAKPHEPLRIISHLVDEDHFHFEVGCNYRVVAEVIVGVDTTDLTGKSNI